VSTSHHTGTADLSPTGPSTYEVRFEQAAIADERVEAITVTVRTATPEVAVQTARHALGELRLGPAAVREV
jgi:hypothetical protein